MTTRKVIEEGSEIRIECDAIAIEKTNETTWKWKLKRSNEKGIELATRIHQNRKPQNSVDILVLSNATTEISGSLTCIAENAIGIGWNSVHILVYCNHL